METHTNRTKSKNEFKKRNEEKKKKKKNDQKSVKHNINAIYQHKMNPQPERTFFFYFHMNGISKMKSGYIHLPL